MKKTSLILGACIVAAGLGVFGWWYWDENLDSSSDVGELTLADIEERYATHFGFLSLENEQDLVEEYGIVWDRPHAGPFVANEIGYSKYDYANVDEYVDFAQERGIVTLATIWPFEEDDQLTCHADEPAATGQFGQMPSRLYLPCDLAAYQKFVGAMVERYDGDGNDDYEDLRYPIRHWEVSNEPEMQGEGLTFFQGTPAEYATLLQKTAEAIRAADANAVVVQGGAAGAGEKTWDFWGDVFATPNIGASFDIANIHSLSGSEDLYVADFKAFLEKHGITGKPIWVTEAQFGSKVFGPLMPTAPGSSPAPRKQTTQEELVRDGVLLAFAHGADKIFWTTYRAPRFQQGDLGQEMTEAAFVEGDGTKRASHRWFAEYTQKLNHFTTLTQTSSLQFETPNGTVNYDFPKYYPN